MAHSDLSHLCNAASFSNDIRNTSRNSSFWKLNSWSLNRRTTVQFTTLCFCYFKLLLFRCLRSNLKLMLWSCFLHLTLGISLISLNLFLLLGLLIQQLNYPISKQSDKEKPFLICPLTNTSNSTILNNLKKNKRKYGWKYDKTNVRELNI